MLNMKKNKRERATSEGAAMRRVVTQLIKQRAREIEQWAAEKLLKGEWVGGEKGPFDVKCPDSIIEVKSCMLKVRTGNFFQKGRFVIIGNSHEVLLSEAEAIAKTPAYLFVVYEVQEEDETKWNPVDATVRSWDFVEKVLKSQELPDSKRHTTERYDGVKSSKVPYHEVFGKVLQSVDSPSPLIEASI
jgi:hypothetical protein